MLIVIHILNWETQQKPEDYPCVGFNKATKENLKYYCLF